MYQSKNSLHIKVATALNITRIGQKYHSSRKGLSILVGLFKKVDVKDVPDDREVRYGGIGYECMASKTCQNKSNNFQYNAKPDHAFNRNFFASGICIRSFTCLPKQDCSLRHNAQTEFDWRFPPK